MSTDDPWFAASVVAPLTAHQPSSAPTQAFEGARYETRGTVAQGGIGTVEVVRDQWLDRDVARKVLRDASDARLAREARITARLNHPNIVPVLDAGSDEEGRLYYIMRLLRGCTLADAARRNEHDLITRVRCLRAAAVAVGYAHSVGIVHRDLKPHNIMIGSFGETQVVDWGLALSVDEDGALEGTPGYSAPEQLMGATPSRCADIYALGRTLQALVLGHDPGPSPRLEPAELHSIAVHATQMDPAARYPSATAFAEDLTAWLEGRRVRAHRYGTGELLGRASQRYAVPLVVLSISALITAGVALHGISRTAAERDRALAAEAQSQRHLAALLADRAVSALVSGNYAEAELLAVEALDRVESPSARGVLAAWPHEGLPTLLEERPMPPCGRPVPLTDGSLLCIEDDRTVAWDIDPLAQRFEVVGPTGQPVELGDTLALPAAHPDPTLRTVHLVDRVTGEPLQQIDVEHPLAGNGPLSSVRYQATVSVLDPTPVRFEACPAARISRWAPQFSPSGTLAWECRTRLLWRRDGQHTEISVGEAEVSGLSWWDDHDLLAGTWGGEILLVDTRTDQVRWRAKTGVGDVHNLHPITSEWLAMLGDRDGVQFMSRSGVLGPRLPAQDGVDLSPSDGRVLTVGNRFAIWSTPAQSLPHRVTVDGGITTLRWHEDGQRIAAGGKSLTVVHRDGRTEPLERPCSSFKDVVWAGEDTAVVCAGSVFPTEGQLAPVAGFYRRIENLGDGFVAASYSSTSARWPDRHAPEPVQETGPDFADLERAANTGRVVALTNAGELWTTDAIDAPFVRRSGGSSAIGIAVHPDGERVVQYTSSKVRVVGLDGQILYSLDADEPPVDLAWSPDGQWIAWAGLHGVATVLHADTGEVLATLHGHTGRVSAVEFSPDSRTLATGSWDHSVRFWSMSRMTGAAEVDPVRARWGLTLEQLQ